MALAAILVGLGVLLLIGYNWEEMPPPLKVTAIFGALIGTHATAFGLRYRLGWRRVSEVVFFMGCLFYGAAIWLLAQIFHIESSNYDAIWWWAIGVLPFALLARHDLAASPLRGAPGTLGRFRGPVARPS